MLPDIPAFSQHLLRHANFQAFCYALAYDFHDYRLACVRIPRDKGHSDFACGCLRVWLGSLAFLLVTLERPDYKALGRRDVSEERLRRCPRCNEWTRTKAKLCGHRGSETGSRIPSNSVGNDSTQSRPISTS